LPSTGLSIMKVRWSAAEQEAHNAFPSHGNDSRLTFAESDFGGMLNPSLRPAESYKRNVSDETEL
jgi:hypothetical protein